MNFRESVEAELIEYWWEDRTGLPEDDYRWIRNAEFELAENEDGGEYPGYVFS